MFDTRTRAKLALVVLAVATGPTGVALAGERSGPSFPEGVATSQPAMPGVGHGYRADRTPSVQRHQALLQYYAEQAQRPEGDPSSNA